MICLSEKPLNTIAWQRRQLNNVRITLTILANKGLIKTTLSQKKATEKYVRDLDGRLEVIVEKASDRLWQIPKVQDMLFSKKDSLLLYNVVHNYKSDQNLERIALTIDDPSVVLWEERDIPRVCCVPYFFHIIHCTSVAQEGMVK